MKPFFCHEGTLSSWFPKTGKSNSSGYCLMVDTEVEVKTVSKTIFGGVKLFQNNREW